MVNCFQVSSLRPCSSLQAKLRPNPKYFPVVEPTHRVFSASSSYANSLPYQFNPLLKHRPLRAKCHQVSPVCLLDGKDKSEGGGEGSSLNPFQKAVEGFKGQTVEDVLRQQMQKQEFYGGSGKNPPPSSGGGGGGEGGGGDDSEGSDDGLSGSIDETLQVILATLGFIFLYIYILTGEELLRLAKDYIRYLFGGSESVRLKKALQLWRRFVRKLKEKKEVDEYWLEKTIIATPTAYDSPQKYRRIFSAYSSDSD